MKRKGLIARGALAAGVMAVLFPAVVDGGTQTFNLVEWVDEADLPSGWTQYKVSHSSEGGVYRGGALFGASGSSLQSPSFGCAITEVRIQVCCNVPDSPKVLTLFPLMDRGQPGAGIPLAFPESPGLYEYQNVDLSDLRTDAFRLEVVGAQSGVNWYVMKIVVSFDETVVIEPHGEPVAPRMAIGNRWKVSDFSEGAGEWRTRTADFGFVGRVEKMTPWTNGLSIDSIYAFDNGRACTNIYVGREKSRAHGLYAVNTNDVGGVVHVLSLLASGDASMELLLPVELDDESPLQGLRVGFRGWRAKVEANETRLAFHWCGVDALDRLDGATWIAAKDGDYSGEEKTPYRTVELRGQQIGKMKFVCFRWSISKVANGSMLGLSDLSVSAALGERGSRLFVR